MKQISGSCAWAVAVLLVTPLAAEEPSAAAPPSLTPEQQAMMDAMMKAGTPGPEHQWLASMAGSWEFTGTSWMGPGGPPTTFKGSEERSMLLGGRVLMAKLTSEVDGMLFEGMGLSGFDNVTKKYWGSWQDNMSTGSMRVQGDCKDGKCEYQSWAPDPMTGKLVTGRMVSESTPGSEHGVMYAPGPDGKEYKAMEFHYTRKK